METLTRLEKWNREYENNIWDIDTLKYEIQNNDYDLQDEKTTKKILSLLLRRQGKLEDMISRANDY